MSLIQQWQLFLFDFDGLLVNTEEIHFKAYQRMCELNGYTLPWNFNRYCQVAHYDAEGLRIQIYEELPELYKKEPNWTNLYQQKSIEVIKLVEEGAVELMPGVSLLLELLKSAQLNRCVVTHSPQKLVNAIRSQLPILDTIDHWITRHDYTNPKPHPESYLKAIKTYAGSNDRIIGFEDTPRGLRALAASSAEPVLICQAAYPEIPTFVKQGIPHFSSLNEWLRVVSG